MWVGLFRACYEISKFQLVGLSFVDCLYSKPLNKHSSRAPLPPIPASFCSPSTCSTPSLLRPLLSLLFKSAGILNKLDCRPTASKSGRQFSYQSTSVDPTLRTKRQLPIPFSNHLPHFRLFGRPAGAPQQGVASCLWLSPTLKRLRLYNSCLGQVVLWFPFPGSELAERRSLTPTQSVVQSFLYARGSAWSSSLVNFRVFVTNFWRFCLTLQRASLDARDFNNGGLFSGTFPSSDSSWSRLVSLFILFYLGVAWTPA